LFRLTRKLRKNPKSALRAKQNMLPQKLSF
jgi:hypothetical protein